MSEKEVEKENCRTFTWSREIISDLILQYEHHPNLYSVRQKDYHNKNARQQSLEDICNAINSAYLSSLTVGDIAKKIHGLRTTYFNELNKIKKSKASGASTDEIYVPKWQYFDLLYFLNDAAVLHQGESNLKENIEETAQEIIFQGTIEELNETYNVTPSSSRSESRSSSVREESLRNNPLKRKKETNSQITGLLSSATSALQKISAPKIDRNRNEIFGKMLAAEMETINEEEVLDTLKEEIMSALFKAKRLVNNNKT